MICRLCKRDAQDVALRVVNVRPGLSKRSGFMAIARCRDRTMCRQRWEMQGHPGPYPLIESTMPTPHFLRETP